MCWPIWVTRNSRRSASMLTDTVINLSKASRGCWEDSRVSVSLIKLLLNAAPAWIEVFSIHLNLVICNTQVPTHTWRSTAPIRAQFWLTWQWMIKSFNLLRKRYKHELRTLGCFIHPSASAVCDECLFFLLTDAKHNSGAQGWRKRRWRFQSIQYHQGKTHQMH